MAEQRQVRRRELVALCRGLARRGGLDAGAPRTGRLVVAAFTSRRALMIDLPVFTDLPPEHLVVLTCPDAPLSPQSGVHVVSLALDEPLSVTWQMGVAGPGGSRHLVATVPEGEPPPYAHDPPDRELGVVLSDGAEASAALSALLAAVEARLTPGVSAAALRLVA